jgi:cytochrome P450
MGNEEYDPLGADTLADPFPAYARLRAQCPVHHHEAFTPPFFTLSRHADVLEGLRDAELWSMRYGDNPQYIRATGLFNDPPEHTAYRKLFNRGFTPRVVGRMEDDIGTVADELLDAMVQDRTRADFHEAFASRLPIIVIARLLGVPAGDLELFREMCDALVATYNVPDPAVSAAPRRRLDDYFVAHLDERRHALATAGVTVAGPEHLGTVLPDDLVSSFVVAEVDGRRLTVDVTSLMLLLLLLGGLESSTALLTNLVWRLLEDRSRWEAVRADRALVPVAIEESLRHDPPVLGLFRTPTREVERHGVTIPAKAKTMLCFASANRDEATGLDDPESFRLDRGLDATRNHLSFGFGAHFCPGAALARLEARLSLERLLDRLPELRLDGPTERIVPFILWGRSSVPLAWRAATS